MQKVIALSVVFLGAVVFAFGLGTLFALWKAYWFLDIWQWFIVDKFGLPALDIYHAWGLFICVGFLMGRRQKDENIKHGSFWGYHLLGPPMGWAVAWLIKNYFMV